LAGFAQEHEKNGLMNAVRAARQGQMSTLEDGKLK